MTKYGARAKAKGMDPVRKHASRGVSPALQPPLEMGGFRQPAGGAGPGRLFSAGIGVAVLLFAASCGVKAPPRPRELVVPAPIEKVTVTAVPDGLKVAFTLPSKSLDGAALKTIGGYRIVREGPDGRQVREAVQFSVSDRRRKVGKRVTFLDEPPASAGTYRYCVVPLDAYGSHASRSRIQEFCWEGFLPAEQKGRQDSRPAPIPGGGE